MFWDGLIATLSPTQLFVCVLLLDLIFVFICYLLGREFLYVAVIANIMFTNMVSAKLVTVFGLDQTVANVFYAAIFLATDLLSEHHGHKYARRAVWMGFLALTPIIFFAPFVKAFPPAISAGTEISDALGVIFSYTPRIVLASLTAYVIAQNVDVFLFAKLKEWKPDNSFLWLRNNGSTMISQFIDQAVFVTLAFAGVVPNAILLQIFIAGYIIKLMVAAIDTPFIYLSHVFKRTPQS